MLHAAPHSRFPILNSQFRGAVTFADAVSRLEAAFRSPLPGPAAQARMAVMPRRKWAPGFPAERVRNAAGLILVFPKTTINAEPAESAEHGLSQRVQRAPRLP